MRCGCGECRACGWYTWFRVLCLAHLTCYGWQCGAWDEELVEYVRSVWLGEAWVERG